MKPRSLISLLPLLGVNDGKIDTEVLVKGIAVDSRLLRAGDLFFALKGEHVDGHTYLAEAASRGASGAVVSRTYSGRDFGLPLIKVDDGLITLQGLARNYIREWENKIIAITGSVGKTTTKEMVLALLKKKYKVASSPGNSNSQIGIPLAILNNSCGDEEYFVLEMGMTESGHLKGLVSIAPPDIALVTSVALVHACNFACIEDIAKAKAELLSHDKTSKGIIADTPFNEIFFSTGKSEKSSFSLSNPKTDYYGYQRDGDFFISHMGKEIRIGKIPVPGMHNLHNFLGAAAAASQAGVEWDLVIDAIADLKLPERRLERVEKQGVIFINDSYNASVPSVKAALELLPQPAPGCRKIAVLGEMLELGAFSLACHSEIGEYSLRYADRMFCFGKECLPIYEKWIGEGREADFFEHLPELVESLKKEVRSGDVVLLKGSRSKGMWRVLEGFN